MTIELRTTREDIVIRARADASIHPELSMVVLSLRGFIGSAAPGPDVAECWLTPAEARKLAGMLEQLCENFATDDYELETE